MLDDSMGESTAAAVSAGGDNRPKDFFKFELDGYTTLYAYKLLAKPDIILKIFPESGSEQFVIPMNRVFFGDCQILKKKRKEEFDDPECYSISGFSAEAVRKYLQHYHLRIHYPQVELKLTVDNCNDVRKIALYCGDEEIAKQAQAYFQKNISNANLKDAIEIGMYEAVANFVPDAYQGITDDVKYTLERLDLDTFVKILGFIKAEDFVMESGYYGNRLGEALVKVLVSIVLRDTSAGNISIGGGESSSSIGKDKKRPGIELVERMITCLNKCMVGSEMKRQVILGKLGRLWPIEESRHAVGRLYGQITNRTATPDPLASPPRHVEIKWNVNIKYFFDMEQSRIVRQKTPSDMVPGTNGYSNVEPGESDGQLNALDRVLDPYNYNWALGGRPRRGRGGYGGAREARRVGVMRAPPARVVRRPERPRANAPRQDLSPVRPARPTAVAQRTVNRNGVTATATTYIAAPQPALPNSNATAPTSSTSLAQPASTATTASQTPTPPKTTTDSSKASSTQPANSAGPSLSEPLKEAQKLLERHTQFLSNYTSQGLVAASKAEKRPATPDSSRAEKRSSSTPAAASSSAANASASAVPPVARGNDGAAQQAPAQAPAAARQAERVREQQVARDRLRQQQRNMVDQLRRYDYYGYGGPHYMNLRKSIRGEIQNRGWDELSPMGFYYEVKILHLEADQRVFGIGVGSSTFDTNADVMVGWRDNSYGYHSDDGGYFENAGQAGGPRGKTYGTGDTVGCGYFPAKKAVYFTLNGEHVHTVMNVPSVKYYPIMTFKADHATERATSVLLLEQDEFRFDCNFFEENFAIFQTASTSNVAQAYQDLQDPGFVPPGLGDDILGLGLDPLLDGYDAF